MSSVSQYIKPLVILKSSTLNTLLDAAVTSELHETYMTATRTLDTRLTNCNRSHTQDIAFTRQLCIPPCKCFPRQPIIRPSGSCLESITAGPCLLHAHVFLHNVLLSTLFACAYFKRSLEMGNRERREDRHALGVYARLQFLHDTS